MRVINHTAVKGPNAKYNRPGHSLRFQVVEHGVQTDIHGREQINVKRLVRVIEIPPGESDISKADFEAAYRKGDGAILVEAVKRGTLEFPDHPALAKAYGTTRHLEQKRLDKLNISLFSGKDAKASPASDDVAALQDQLAAMQGRLAEMEARDASSQQNAA